MLPLSSPKRSRRLPLAALPLALLPLALSCSPVVRVRSQVLLPAGGGSPNAAYLHVTAATSPTNAHLAPPAAASGATAALGFNVSPGSNDFEVELTIRGSRLYVNLTVWYDSNANGRVDAGDALGSLGTTPILAEDRGLCAGNITRTPPITLKAVP